MNTNQQEEEWESEEDFTEKYPGQIAEQSVLSSILINPSCYDDVRDIISASSFANEFHKNLFSAFDSLISKKIVIDVVTVCAELSDSGIEANASYLLEMRENTYRAANVMAYAGQVAERSLARALQLASHQVSKTISQGPGSPKDRLDKSQAILMAIEPNDTGINVRSAKDLMKDHITQLEENFKNKTSSGLLTGFTDFDKRLSGMKPADLILIAARPSMGKTTFLLNLLQEACVNNDHNALFFSLEMSSGSILDRLISSVGSVPYSEVQNFGGHGGDNDFDFYEAATTIANSGLHIDDTGGLSINELRSRARKQHRATPLSMIAVDYIQLMTAEGDNRTQQVGAISKGLKNLAKELKIPVVALSQLNRGLEQRQNKRPLLSDLRESGDLEQDGDVISFLYRDVVYDPSTQEPNITELITRKYRNGRVGTDYLISDLGMCRFKSNSGQSYVAPPKENNGPKRDGLDDFMSE